MADERSSSIGEIVMIGLIVVIFAVIVIVLSPVWIPFVIFSEIKERLARRKFLKYLAENEGAKFFCYTHRKTSKEFVETKIVPFLGEDIKVFHIADKGWKNLPDENGFEFRIVLSMKTVKGGFPYISKIVNGELVTRSLNDRVYSAITRKAEADVIIGRIEKFFN